MFFSTEYVYACTYTHINTQLSALRSSVPLKILEESEHNSTASSILPRSDILFKELKEETLLAVAVMM